MIDFLPIERHGPVSRTADMLLYFAPVDDTPQTSRKITGRGHSTSRGPLRTRHRTAQRRSAQTPSTADQSSPTNPSGGKHNPFSRGPHSLSQPPTIACAREYKPLAYSTRAVSPVVFKITVPRSPRRRNTTLPKRNRRRDGKTDPPPSNRSLLPQARTDRAHRRRPAERRGRPRRRRRSRRRRQPNRADLVPDGDFRGAPTAAPPSPAPESVPSLAQCQGRQSPNIALSGAPDEWSRVEANTEGLRDGQRRMMLQVIFERIARHLLTKDPARSWGRAPRDE